MCSLSPWQAWLAIWPHPMPTMWIQRCLEPFLTGSGWKIYFDTPKVIERGLWKTKKHRTSTGARCEKLKVVPFFDERPAPSAPPNTVKTRNFDTVQKQTVFLLNVWI
jgi:hypothetical protein